MTLRLNLFLWVHIITWTAILLAILTQPFCGNKFDKTNGLGWTGTNFIISFLLFESSLQIQKTIERNRKNYIIPQYQYQCIIFYIYFFQCWWFQNQRKRGNSIFEAITFIFISNWELLVEYVWMFMFGVSGSHGNYVNKLG